MTQRERLHPLKAGLPWELLKKNADLTITVKGMFAQGPDLVRRLKEIESALLLHTDRPF